MLSTFRRAELSSMVNAILTSIRNQNPPDAQRVLARFVKGRIHHIMVEDLERKKTIGEGAARAMLATSAEELKTRRRLREQFASCEGEPDLAALLLEEYFVISLLASDASVWLTFDNLIKAWYEELGGIELTYADYQRGKTSSTFKLEWLDRSKKSAATQSLHSA